MRLSQTENNLLGNGNYNIIGTSISGVDNYVGPMISCSLVLDYFNISRYVEPLLKNVKLDGSELKELVNSFRYSSLNFMDASTINMLKDLELSEHMSKFNSANKVVWSMLKKCEVPDAYITSDKELMEVIDTIDDSLHSDNNKRYVLWNTNHSLELITPKAVFITKPCNKTVVTKLARRIADLALEVKLNSIGKEYPKYHIPKYPDSIQEKYVEKYGNTVYHRLFMGNLSKYPIGRMIFDD
jgi:hypothetical protein